MEDVRRGQVSGCIQPTQVFSGIPLRDSALWFLLSAVLCEVELPQPFSQVHLMAAG